LPESGGFLYHGRVQQFDALVIENKPVAESWRELVLSWEAEAPEPGQFLTLRASPFSDPLLRRPFAFASHKRAFASHKRAFASHKRAFASHKRAFSSSGRGSAGDGETVSVIYQVRGGATRALSDLAPGSKVDALGPLGKGFPLPEADETPIVAGGGIGLGPLLFLHDRIAEERKESAPSSGRGDEPPAAPLLVLGFRSASLMPSIDLPKGTVVCTDDGSSGFRGTPVDWISRNAPTGKARLYGCGPLPMLAALADLAAAKKWRAALSAEQWMACGVGACMGCALPRAKGYQGAEGLPRADGAGYLRACADGPVFDSTEIDWRAGR
jgi:dihydroorotate dehydrogenase electron transfer subunit